MENNYKLQNIVRKNQRLFDIRKQIMEMPAEKTVDALLQSFSPASLIQSFPEEDLFFMMHDVGVKDFLPVLSLASSQQWEYIIDVEVWIKDKVNFSALTQWLEHLLQADQDRLINWTLLEKVDFIEYYLKKNIIVQVREHDEDPSDFDDGFFTIDDVFYIKFIEYPANYFENENTENENTENENTEFEDKQLRDKVVTQYLTRLAQINHVIYQDVLLEMSTVIYSEVEEESYRLKNVRLAEKGFMPFSEAIGIYQPMKLKNLLKTDRKITSLKKSADEYFIVPFFPSKMIQDDDLFSCAIKNIKNDEILQQLLAEFAGLCNIIISADQNVIRGKEDLGGIVKKACDYLSIGLEIIGKKDVNNLLYLESLISRYQLQHLFRIGYSSVQKLKWQAEKWYLNSWTKKAGLTFDFWDYKGLGVLGGLFIKRPLFFDNYKKGTLYREFKSLEDIKNTEKVFNEIMAFDNLFQLMELEILVKIDKFVDYKMFILTIWARVVMKLSKTFEPIKLTDYKKFILKLFTEKQAVSLTETGKIGLKMKEQFLKWLSKESGITTLDISHKLGKTLEELFNKIEEEYGAVSMDNIDHKYINLFDCN